MLQERPSGDNNGAVIQLLEEMAEDACWNRDGHHRSRVATHGAGYDDAPGLVGPQGLTSADGDDLPGRPDPPSTSGAHARADPIHGRAANRHARRDAIARWLEPGG